MLYSYPATTMANLFGGNDDIDFDKAASAFPDISLDGSGDIPAVSSPPAPAAAGGGFSFDTFDSFDSPATPQNSNVKVTGDDVIGKFESEFPDIQVPV